MSDARTWEDFSWLPDGRILYVIDEPTPNGENENFWEARTDVRTGALVGPPRRVSDLLVDAFLGALSRGAVGSGMRNLSVSADGSKAAFLKYSGHSSISVGRLQPSGLLEAPRRLTAEDYWDFPWDWTADSRSVIFTRNGRRSGTSIYKQALESDAAELIFALNPRWSQGVRSAPTGTSLFFLQQASLG